MTAKLVSTTRKSVEMTHDSRAPTRDSVATGSELVEETHDSREATQDLVNWSLSVDLCVGGANGEENQ